MASTKVAAPRKRHVPTNVEHVYKSETKAGWVFEFRHPYGKRQYEVVGTMAEAKAYRDRILGTKTKIASAGTTLADVVESWKQARDVKPRTAESYDRIVKQHIETSRLYRMKVRDIGVAEITAWLTNLKRHDGQSGGLSAGSKRLALAVLNLVLKHGVEMGAIGSVPQLPKATKKRLAAPTGDELRRRIVTADEETRLFAYCEPFPWMRPILTLALNQGLRLGEIAGLQWEDVDLVGEELTIKHTVSKMDGSLGTPKGGKARYIDLMPAAKAALLELRIDSDGTGYVFRNTVGGPRQMRDIQRAFDKARDRAALQVTRDGRVCFHSLRHTCLSRLAQSPDVALAYVRDFAGHSSIAITEAYIHGTRTETSKSAAAKALAAVTA